MSKLRINQFINTSKFYLRLTEKDLTMLTIDEIERLLNLENAPISENIEISFTSNAAQID